MSEENKNVEPVEETAGKKPQKLTDIAEVRMVLYVIPVAIVFVVVALILSQF